MYPKNVLADREYQVPGNWYAPKKHLEQFPSVKWVEIYDMTSSAGDWNGVFAQKVNNQLYIIPFSQENMPWTQRFKLYTSEPLMIFTKETMNGTKNELLSVIYSILDNEYKDY